MSRKASLNQIGGPVITVEEAVRRYKDGCHDKYYCTGMVDGQVCGCEMTLCALGSVKKSPYFGGRTRHLEGCPNYINEKIRIKNIYGRISRDPGVIDIVSIINTVTKTATGGTVITPPTGPLPGPNREEKDPVPTIEVFHQFKVPSDVKELYYAFKSNSIDTIYPSGCTTANHLIDDRVYHLHRNGQVQLSRTAIGIASKCIHKDIRDKLALPQGYRWIMMDPYVDQQGVYDPRIIFVLDFANHELFDLICKRYFMNQKYKDNIYLISGSDWDKLESNIGHTVYRTTVYNKKQIIPLKKDIAKEQLLRLPYKDIYK